MRKLNLLAVLGLFTVLIALIAISPNTTHAAVLLSATFDTDSQGFVYADDAFRGTSQPDYASGTYDAAEGHAGGGLTVTLGGVDGADIFDGMSGGWSYNFNVSSAGPVTITLRYRLVHVAAHEPLECGQAVVAVDGVLMGTAPDDYLVEFCGTGSDQDTGWQQVTLTPTLQAGNHTLSLGGYLSRKTSINEYSYIYFDEVVIDDGGSTPTTETDCSDSIDNDGDGQTDCSDSDCAAACSGSSNILTATFDTDSEGFTYADDTFRSTSQPVYASGAHDAAAGHAGGGLTVTVGGVDGADIFDGMSGGWSHDFNLASAGPVTITLRYRLVHDAAHEPLECSQAVVAVDGVLMGVDPNDYLVEFCGTGSEQDTGWQQVTLTPTLQAGSHTLTLGGYLSRKTSIDEYSYIYFDDVTIDGAGGTPTTETNCSDSIDNDGDGQIDCNDTDCSSDSACTGPTTETDCSDDVDNDGDGNTDCLDSDCSADPACTGPTTETACSDGVDNDSDGQTDCDDEDCFTDPVCSSDSDGDGMPNDWENLYGLNPSVNDRNEDLDGDGISNWVEYRLGTDPSVPNDKGPGVYYEYDALGRIRKIERIPSQ